MTSSDLQECIKVLCENFNRGYQGLIMIFPNPSGEHDIFCVGKFDIGHIVIGGDLVEFEEYEDEEEE